MFSLLRYHIIDTIESSATHARIIFENKWDDLINVIEGILTSNYLGYNENQNVRAYLKDFMDKVSGSSDCSDYSSFLTSIV